MASFEVTHKGVPFTVKNVENEDAARAAVLEAVQKNPEIHANKAVEMGLKYDFATGEARPYTGTEKFKIGMGKAFADTGHNISSLLSPEADIAAEDRQMVDQAIFDKLSGSATYGDDGESFVSDAVSMIPDWIAGDGERANLEGFMDSLAEPQDWGELVGHGLQWWGGARALQTMRFLAAGNAATGAAAGTVAAPPAASIMSHLGQAVFTPIRWVRNLGKSHKQIADNMKRSMQNGVNQGVVETAIKSPAGTRAVQAASRAKNPSKAKAEKLDKAIVKEANKNAEQAALPTRNPRVSEAQVRIQREFRRQDATAPRQTGNTQAQAQGASQAAQAQTRQQAARQQAQSIANQAKNAQARRNTKAQRKADKAELRGLIKKANTQVRQSKGSPNASVRSAGKEVSTKSKEFAAKMREAEKAEARMLKAQEAFEKLQVKDAGKTTFSNSQTRTRRLR